VQFKAIGLAGRMQMVLGIKDYTEGKPIPTESMLNIQKFSNSDEIQGDLIWVQSDKHFCSFVGDQCHTLSNRKKLLKRNQLSL